MDGAFIVTLCKGTAGGHPVEINTGNKELSHTPKPGKLCHSQPHQCRAPLGVLNPQLLPGFSLCPSCPIPERALSDVNQKKTALSPSPRPALPKFKISAFLLNSYPAEEVSGQTEETSWECPKVLTKEIGKQTFFQSLERRCAGGN